MINLKIDSLLIADDDMDDIMLLLSAIDSCTSDLSISHVRDGEALIAFLQQKMLPGLILLDINMPKINGVDCLKRIKSNEQFNQIPIIMYSTSSNREIIDKCYQFGASRYIIKPYRYDDIVHFVKMILSINWVKSKVSSKKEFLLSPGENLS